MATIFTKVKDLLGNVIAAGGGHPIDQPPYTVSPIPNPSSPYAPVITSKNKASLTRASIDPMVDKVLALQLFTM